MDTIHFRHKSKFHFEMFNQDMFLWHEYLTFFTKKGVLEMVNLTAKVHTKAKEKVNLEMYQDHAKAFASCHFKKHSRQGQGKSRVINSEVCKMIYAYFSQ